MRYVLIFATAFAFGLGRLCAADAVAPSPPAVPEVPLPPVDFKTLPWVDGETLTYLVSWGTAQAAQATFSAHDKTDHWEFNLDLGSLGWVSSFYPFTANLWCLASKSTWRSVEYGQYRFEPHYFLRERTRIDYTAHAGNRERWSDGSTKTFTVAEDSLDDVGTMLYHIRALPWKAGDKRILHVYESDSEKEGEITCEGPETRTFGTLPAQSYMKVLALPGAGTHRKGHLRIWMTNDARKLPVHAELEFVYGTFDIDLTKSDKLLPIK